MTRRNTILSTITSVVLFLLIPSARADYFSKDKFKSYDANGVYPFWSKTWLSLDPRVHTDKDGVPFVSYRSGAQYNPVTVAIFGLLAYDRFSEKSDAGDRAIFLKMADWLVSRQDQSSGCWYYDFDFEYRTLNEKILEPWVSAMAQGLGISVLTRAYHLTGRADYLAGAAHALLPFHKKVEEGGVSRDLNVLAGSAAEPHLVFYEEYPTRRTPSYTLNGFMFSLIGLYDLSQLGNSDAKELFTEGVKTLEQALPLFDLGHSTSYDLGHLTSPPRPVHGDAGYHLIHITLLNALGTATRSESLLWYRDHWNSYGMPLETEAIWFGRLGYWFHGRYPYGAYALTALLGFGLVAVVWRWRFVRQKKRRRQGSRESLARQQAPASA